MKKSLVSWTCDKDQYGTWKPWLKNANRNKTLKKLRYRQPKRVHIHDEIILETRVILSTSYEQKPILFFPSVHFLLCFSNYFV